MRRVAIITCQQFPALYEDDRPLLPALERRGVRGVAVVWTETTMAELATFDGVLVRSPWDWFHHRERFRVFLDGLAQLGRPVFNPPAVLRTFADKLYLVDLEARGVTVVPTVVVEQAALSSVPRLIAERGWTRCVLKPAFTANASGAGVFDAAGAEAAVSALPVLPAGERWLVQPYLPEVERGEVSFVFLDGHFSHALRKVPAPGEWRVQEAYGGRVVALDASPALLAQATHAANIAAPDALYVRVDGVVVEGALVLMELEAVEPMLFLSLGAGAVDRLAEGLVRRLPPRR